MRSVVIEITAPARAGTALGVRLLTGESADLRELTPIKGATAKIPLDLSPEIPVDYPPGSPLKVSDIPALLAGSNDESDAFEAVGKFLFHLVARGKVATEWRRLRREFVKGVNDAPALRTVLAIDGGSPAIATLQSLPWEMLYDPTESIHPSLEHPIVRGISRPQARPPDESWPLRVLVVFGAPPDEAGETNIGAEAELTALECLFASVRFDVEYELLMHPAPSEIVSACELIRPHVLHFIGHGRAADANGDARLLIHRGPGAENQDSEFHSWPAPDIRTRLRSVAPRLAFLNACRTSDAPEGEALVPISTLADSFLKAGSLGVVGMQGDVPGDLAKIFSAEFYKQLIAGQALDVATFRGRVRMSEGRAHVLRRAEWTYPVLRTTVAPALVLPDHSSIDGQQWVVSRFVSRVQQRRAVREAAGTARPSYSPAASASLVVIKGERDSGKSHLAKWCGQLCEARGMLRLPVELPPTKEALDLLDVLRWIRDGQRHERGKPPVRAPNWPLPEAAFRAFNRNLNLRLRGLDVSTTSPAGNPGNADQGLRLAEGIWPEENLVTNTLQEFRAALTEAIAKRPTLLVLDHLDWLDEPTLNQWLFEGLFQPVAQGGIPGLHLLVIVGSTTYEEKMSRLRQATPASSVVDVRRFRREEYEPLTRFLCRQYSEDVLNLTSQMRSGLLLKGRQEPTWPATMLRTIEGVCQVLVKAAL